MEISYLHIFFLFFACCCCCWVVACHLPSHSRNHFMPCGNMHISQRHTTIRHICNYFRGTPGSLSSSTTTATMSSTYSSQANMYTSFSQYEQQKLLLHNATQTIQKLQSGWSLGTGKQKDPQIYYSSNEIYSNRGTNKKIAGNWILSDFEKES